MGLINKSFLVTLNQRVPGSSPGAPTKSFRDKTQRVRTPRLPAAGLRTSEFCGSRRLRPGLFSQVLRPQPDRHGSDSLGVVLPSFRLMTGFDESLSGLARVRPEAMSGRPVRDTIFGQLELVMSRLDFHHSKASLTKDCSPFTKATEARVPGLFFRNSPSAFSNRSERPQVR